MIPRTFQAYQAIAASPKTSTELRRALGCTDSQAQRAVQRLCDADQIRRRNRPGCRGGYVYEVAP
jgi:predicted transcriptional regulator